MGLRVPDFLEDTGNGTLGGDYISVRSGRDGIGRCSKICKASRSCQLCEWKSGRGFKRDHSQLFITIHDLYNCMLIGTHGIT